MKLNASKPINITEDLILLVSKNTSKLIEQTQTKAQETLEFNLTKSGESFSFDIP